MSSISFKGTRDGLRITLGEGAWRDLLAELAQMLDRPGAQSFFRGARVLLETGDRTLSVAELEELNSLLSKHQMTLGTALTEKTPPPARAPSDLSIPPPETFIGHDGHENKYQTEGHEMLNATGSGHETQTLLIRRTVRSGQVITHPGMVIIIGDINPGAEVVAGGDVIVWGKVRGVVHAGASGDETAIVGALSLAPTQLRIGGAIGRAPDDKRPRHAPAEIARVQDGLIVIEPWSSGSG